VNNGIHGTKKAEIMGNWGLERSYLEMELVGLGRGINQVELNFSVL
jgi:hypothetical protein